MSPLFLTLFLLEGMFHLARHERIGILFEDTQAGTGAEIDLLAAIHNAGIICWVFKVTSAGSFIFRQWGGGNLCQI